MGKDFKSSNRGNQQRPNRGGNKPRNFRGNRGGIGSKKFSKPKATIINHRFEGIYILKTGKEESLVTLNLNPGESVYGEKRVSIEEQTSLPDGTNTQPKKIEYRVWNIFRSKLGAAIINGIEKIYMKPGSKVLYLGAANGTTISHVSDIIGEDGIVYGVEISKRSGRDLINMAKKRTNLVPIIDDARKPYNYRFLIPTLVDCIFADVAQPDQARIIAINAEHFLKDKGGFVFSIKANCVDSTLEPEVVFDNQIKVLKGYGLYAKEQVTLEPYERGHAVVSGIYKRKSVIKKYDEKEEEEDNKENNEEKEDDEVKEKKSKKSKKKKNEEEDDE
jgi:rRNA 2'-O-methyltransferase fibrillarin